MKNQQGLTLIEMIVVIVLIGVLGTITAELIRQPVDASISVNERVALANDADNIMTRITRDIRLSVPNSIRVSIDGTTIEMIKSEQGGRYRFMKNSIGTGDVLDFNAPDISFDVLSPLNPAPQPGQFIIIYNLDANGNQANAWFGDNRAIVATGTTNTNIQLTSAFQFPFHSTAQRFYLSSGPVQYRCSNGEIKRYEGYSMTNSIIQPPIQFSSILSKNIDQCSFSYLSGSSTRQGLVDLTMTISKSQEKMTLKKSIHVGNVP